MKVDLFDFDLPKNLIANKSQDPRDSAKMLAINGNSYLDKKISDLSDIFSEGDIFVVNNTKVIPSRIKLKLNKFSSIEITFLNELKKGIWRTLVRPSKKLNIGDKLLYLNKYIFNLVDKKHNGEV